MCPATPDCEQGITILPTARDREGSLCQQGWVQSQAPGTLSGPLPVLVVLSSTMVLLSHLSTSLVSVLKKWEQRLREVKGCFRVTQSVPGISETAV